MSHHAGARLLAMAPRELATRAAGRARQHVDRLAWQWRRPVWHRADLAQVLDRSVPAIERAAQHLDDGDAASAHRVLGSHFAWRPTRFLLAPRSRDSVARLVRARFPAAAADSRQRADRALDGRLDILGYQDVSVLDSERGAIDWHRDPVHARRAPLDHWSRVRYLDPAIGDHKVIWEINRHQHWLGLGRAAWLTADPRYRAGFIAQLHSWMAANPPRTGINWASMLELALRSLSWIWALHYFADDDRAAATGTAPATEAPWTVDLLLGLHAQLTLVERHLSTYFSPNTHLLGEALGLYVAGRSLPELCDADRWASVGRQILIAETDRQIHADGGHAELSTHYHRYALDFYLMALGIAQVTGDSTALAPFAGATERLARFAHTLSDRRFRLPQFGDDDGGLLLPLCDADALDVGPSLAVAAARLRQPDLCDGRSHEEVVWLTGDIPATRPVIDQRTSAWLPDTGYVVCRTWRGDHLVMDVGPHGYLNGGHAHADALSITLTVAGHPLLIDSGTAGYTDPALRNRFRETAAHNTVVVDDRSQSEPAGPFHWRSRATSRLDVCQLTSRFDYIEARHDGYGPKGHCRQVMARPGCWILVDWIGGSGTRQAVSHWHLHPAWHVTRLDDRRVGLRHGSGAEVWMLTTGIGFSASTGEPGGLGWHAPVYGQLRPATLLRASVHAPPPFALVTVVVESNEAPVLDVIDDAPVAGEDRADVTVHLAASGWRETITARRPLPDGTVHHAGATRSPARLTCARLDTTAATAVSERWEADGRARDRRPADAGPTSADRTAPAAHYSGGR